MKIGGFKKRYKKARITAIMLSLLMMLTLFGDVGYKPVADDATTTTAANFMDVVNEITITPSSSADTPLDYNKALDIVLAFTLPDDVPGGFDISTNYLYQFDINKVTAENKDGSTSTAVNALVNEQDESGLPIVMEGKVVGEYSIKNGVVTLDFQKGISILQDSTISREGTFEFSCSLNQDAFANEGGEYVLKFDTASSTINPTVFVDEKEFIKSGVTVDKLDATFDAENQTATYTIRVENISGGELTDLIISDTMGSNLTYVDGSVSSGITAVQNGQNIKFTMATVPTGTTTFTYTCKVTDGAFTGANSANGGASGTDNTITATLDGNNIFLDNSSTKSDKTSISVKKDVLDKSYEGYVSATNTVKWKIVINAGDDDFDLGGYTFTDTLGNGLTYKEGSITITGEGDAVKAGLQYAITNGTSYEFPEGTKGQYVIEYETTVPQHDGKVTYDNEATVSNGTYTDSDKVYTDPIGEYVSSKEFAGDSANIEIDPVSGDLILPWKTTIKVPANATSLVYNDFVNSWYDENGLGFVIPDGDLNNIFTVTYDGGNLAAGTDYTVEAKQYTTNSYNLTLTDEGLAKVKGKTIEITYETIGSYANKPSDNGSVYKNHYELTIVDNGTNLKESGQAQTEYTPETIIDKWVDKVDAENHTITWAIKVNASDTNVLNDLILTDVMKDMRYYGCPNGNNQFYVHDYNGNESIKAYIVDANSKSYSINMSEVELDDSTDENPKYKYTIDFSNSTLTEINVWDDGNDPLTGTENALVTTFTIYYTTKIEGENLYRNNTTNYENDVKATVTVGNDTTPSTYYASANKDLTTEILTKECAQTTDDGVAVLTYTIEVNPDGLKLNPDADEPYYIVEDTLPASLVYMPDKTVIKDSVTGDIISLADSADTVKTNTDGSKYHVSYTDNVLTFTVPDSKPLTITYKVTMLSDSLAGGVTYINSVKLARPYVSDESIVANQTYKSVASSAANMVGRKLFIVDKLDALDTTKHLSGATFEATEYVYDANAYTWVLSGNVFEGTTAANGTVGADAFTVKSGDQNATISTNRIYEIRETVPPTGYDLTDKVYKIIVVDTDNPIDAWIIPGDTYRITAGTSLLFSDMPSTVLPENKLTITKKYYTADGNTLVDNQTEKAVIEIYEGNLTLEQCKSGSYTPLATGDLGNGFTYEKSGDEIILNRIPTGTYTVYEKSAPEGYDILTNVYHFTVSNYEISWENETAALEVSKEIANKKTFENEIVLHKTYQDQLGNTLTDSNIPENAKFTYKQTHYYDSATSAYVEVANGTVTNISTADGLTYTLKNLPAGRYVIDEVESTVYNKDTNLPLTVEIDSNGTVSIMNSGSGAITDADNTNTDIFDVDVTNVVKENKITVYKYYYDKEGNLIPASAIQETLVDADNVTNQQKVKFTLWKKDGSSYVATAVATDYESYTTNFISAPTDAYIWKNLKPGEYKLTESLVTDGVADLTVYETLHEVYFTVNDDYTISTNTSTAGSYEQTIDVVNRQLDSEACRFYLTKYIADQSGNAAVDTNGDGIKFIMQKKLADGSFEDITFNYNKDKQRWEAVGLKAGEYVVTEVNTLNNYVSADTIEITITTDTSVTPHKDVITDIKYNGDSADFWTTSVVENIVDSDVETVVANVINRPKDNSITVTKKYYQPDEITEVPSLENYAEFTLYELQGSDYVEVRTIEAGGNNTYKFDKLEPGSYKISETYTPTGYVKASDVEFTVKDDYTINVISPTATDTTIAVTNGGTLKVDVTAKNVVNNSFTWTKKYTAIDGTAVEDTTNKDLLFGATEFTVYNAAGDAVVNGVSVDKDNSSYSFKVSNLTEGEYRIKETATPEGYVTSGDIILNVSDGGKISVTYSGTRTDFTNLLNNNTYDVTASLYNRQDTNQLVITKEYYQADGTQIPLNEVLSFASFKIYDSNDNEVTGVTKQFSQSTGTYVFSNIPQGSYKIVETPLSGYKTIADLSFTVDVNGKISYTAGDGWTAGTDNAVMATVTAKNTKLPNGFTVRKLYYDATDADITNNHVNSGNPQASFTLVATNGSGKTYTVNQNGNLYTVNNIPYGTYELKETVPAGYKQVNGTITVNVSENGTITATYTGGDANDFHVTNSGTIEDMEILFTNHGSENSFTVYKTYVSSNGEVISTDELEDSEFANFILYTYDGNGNRVEVDSSKVNIDKTSGIYSFENLESGRYTIVEEAGAGFVDNSNTINFTVNTNKTITNVNGATTTTNSDNYHKFVAVENERAPFDNGVAVTKTFINAGGQDVTDDAMLQNTNFVMKDSDGNVVTGFMYDTTNKCWMIQGLEPGKYVISETDTPDGYVAVSDINVTVTKTAPGVTEVTMSYTGMNASDVTYEYGTTQNPTDTRYMEIKAVNRQEVDNKFVIDKKFISVYGKEITSANVLATYLKSTQFTYKAEGGTNAANIPFDDTTGQYVLEDLQPGTYIISETAHSDFIAISDMKLVVDNDGSLEVIYAGDAGDIVVTESQTELNTTSVEVNNYSKSQFLNISKVDITNGAELPGAKLTITNEDGKVIEEWTSSTGVHKMAVGGFIPNKEYTLTEVTAPYGYDIAESIVFKTDELGNIYVKGSDGTFELVTDNTIVMEDAPKYVTISKVDLVNGAELPGAKLTITDKDGKIVDTWTSTTTPHQMLMTSFKADAEYTLTEVTAPEGYEVAESIIFKIDTSGTIYIKSADGTFTKLTTSMIVMKDAPSATSSSEVETGDSTPIVLLFVLVMLAGLGIIYMMPRKRRI